MTQALTFTIARRRIAFFPIHGRTVVPLAAVLGSTSAVAALAGNVRYPSGFT